MTSDAEGRGHTPEEIAAGVHQAIADAVSEATRQGISRATGMLIENGETLAAFHLLRQSGLTDGNAVAVLDRVGVGGEVLDLLAIEDLSTRPDK